MSQRWRKVVYDTACVLSMLAVLLLSALGSRSVWAQDAWRAEAEVGTCEAKAASASPWYALVPSSAFDRKSSCYTVGAARTLSALRDGAGMRVAFVELGDTASVSVPGGLGSSSARGAAFGLTFERPAGIVTARLEGGALLYQSKLRVSIPGVMDLSQSDTSATPYFGIGAGWGWLTASYRYFVDVKTDGGVTDGPVRMLSLGVVGRF